MVHWQNVVLTFGVERLGFVYSEQLLYRDHWQRTAGSKQLCVVPAPRCQHALHRLPARGIKAGASAPQHIHICLELSYY